MPQIGKTDVVSRITGRDSPNDTATRWDVYGTDLGHMFRHKGSLYMVFGDTFGPQGLLGPRDWRSNVMARIADPEPRHGLPIAAMITGPNGMAKELLSSLKIPGIEKTVIPTNGISVDGRMYLHYMSVRRWGAPGRWTVRYSGLAYSDDDGQNWAKPKAAIWPADSGFEQVAFVRDGELVYSFGIPEGRAGGARLRRVAPARMLDKQAYQYWDGAQWAPDIAASAVLVPGPVGELSVAWSAAHERWLMMYLQEELESVVLRTAPNLTGPWSDAQVVVKAADYPGLYAPFIVPDSEIDGDLYYTMSQWGPYNVSLMRTALDWGGAAVATASATADPATSAAGNGKPARPE
jgi:hypothetical protein